MPFVLVEHHFISFGIDSHSASSHLYRLNIIPDEEVQRGDIDRNRHIRIVRIDSRQCLALGDIRWGRCAREQSL